MVPAVCHTNEKEQMQNSSCCALYTTISTSIVSVKLSINLASRRNTSILSACLPVGSSSK